MAVNLASMVFLLPLFVFAFFPLATPVVASTSTFSDDTTPPHLMSYVLTVRPNLL
jgi:hypothetical protein